MYFKNYFVLILPFLFFNFVVLLSLYTFSTGIYSDEIAAVGYNNGSITFYIYYLFITICSILFVWSLVPRKIKNLNFPLKHKKMVIYISIILLLYFSVPLILYGPTFIQGINRYQFNLLPYVNFFNIKLLLAIFSFVWGAYYSREEKRNSPFLMLYLSFIIICLAYGEKNSGVVDSIIYFICGYFLYSKSKIKFTSLFKFIIFLTFFVLFLFSLQLLLLNTPITELIDSFLIRLGRQSQVFLGAYEQEILTGTVRHDISWSGLNYYFDNFNGMKLIMYNLMPIEQFEKHTGSLAAGYPGVLFFLTNDFFYLTITYILFSVLYIVPFIFYFFMIFRLSHFYFILPIYVFAMTVHLKIFQTGNIFLLTNPKYIVFYCFILCITLLYFTKRNKNNDI